MCFVCLVIAVLASRLLRNSPEESGNDSSDFFSPTSKLLLACGVFFIFMATLFNSNKGIINEELRMENLTVGFGILFIILN